MLRRFLDEDIGGGDVTADSLVAEKAQGLAAFVAKAPGTVAGMEVGRALFQCLDPDSRWQAEVTDGQRVEPGDRLATLVADARSILRGERTALNLLQRMSGIATMTQRFVDAVQGTPAVVLETRKTAPGLRWFDKYSVRAGGGHNHREGLYDQVLIKENHLALMGRGRPLERAIAQSRAVVGPGMLVEIEVFDTPEALRAAAAGADLVLLDNFSPEQVRDTVRHSSSYPQVKWEASGGIDLSNVWEYAETGVHRISVGALTHSAPALDISMLVEPGPLEPGSQEFSSLS